MVRKPVQSHAHGDEVEAPPPSRPARIHDLEVDARGRRAREVLPAFCQHGGGRIGQHEVAVGIALDEVAAEQPGAAAELEHRRPLELGQEPREPCGDRLLQPGMELVASARAPKLATIRRYEGRVSANSRTWRAHQRGCFNGRTWPPSGDQTMFSPQIAALIAGGTMASSREASASTGQVRPCLGWARVPMDQPIGPFVEPGDIQRLGQGKARGAAGPPERLQGAPGLPLQPSLKAASRVGATWQQKQSKPWTLTRALNRPRRARAATIARGNARRRSRPPAIRSPLGSSRDEAEIDQRDLGAPEVGDEVGKDAGVEAPAMNEQETHESRLMRARVSLQPGPPSRQRLQ